MLTTRLIAGAFVLAAGCGPYWVDPKDTFEVYFDDDRVSRVERHEGPGRGWHRRRG